MKKQILFYALLLLHFVACTPKLTDAEKADLRLQAARQMIVDNRLNAAKSELDSVHLLYPKQVTQRRAANYLSDSIAYIESLRTLAYCDTMLIQKEQESQMLLADFRFEKNDKYEDNGHYVYKLLRTESNTERCYLQTYVTQDYKVFVKSNYCGTKKIEHSQVELLANDLSVSSGAGNNHTFTDGGLTWEILTLSDDAAMSLLNFISANETERIQVRLSGTSTYVYYLTESERKALGTTYHLAVVMRDIDQLQQEIRKAHYIINKFEAPPQSF